MVKYFSSIYSEIYTYLSMRERIAAPTVIRFSFYVLQAIMITLLYVVINAMAGYAPCFSITY